MTETGAAAEAAAQENARRRDMNEEVAAEFRANGGRVGGMFEDVDLLLLHHVGARSGAAYVAPLAYLRQGAAYVLIAANGGRARHPGWYHNLLAHPETAIEVGAETVAVRAREAEGAEREELAARARIEAKYYSGFETRTTRPIPFLLLEPVEAAA